ncbi:ThuA domain-containing protein [Shinella pollutisoli]|uniref:ThuA domain-containing protein n=1 Tax=Shinella pollutisoli TaxID=2250594 RepID=A0ABV7DIB6_9HYPH|nr:ThuA domain-containing protein [Shinella pollutisoli]
MKKTIIISGGYTPHRPFEAAGKVKAMLEAVGHEVDLFDDLSAYDRLDLSAYDLIVPNWTLGEMSVETSRKLWQAVASGTGLGGFHGGMVDGFRGNERFRFIVGGAYAAEPGGIRDYRVRVTGRDDPVMEGIEDFDHRSEQYYLHVDPAVQVLAETTFSATPYPWLEGVRMPTVWKKRFGEGRVFFSALGHVPEELDHPSVRSILTRGLAWAAR